jgi:hypothetical protein
MTHGAPQRAATLWLATLPGHRAEARWKSKSRPRPQTVTEPANAMRTRSGFRSQLSFVPQSPNGPAGLRLAGPYYFQPECALFETNKATEGQKEAAGEDDAALVSAWSASHHSPMPDLPECSKGQERCSSRRLIRTRRHACSFALANRGHDTRAWRPRRKLPRGDASPAGAVRMPKALRAKSSHQGGTLPRAAPFSTYSPRSSV